MIAAIVQARMGSTRLPGKTLREILGKPMLWHVVNRVKYCKLINKIIIATTKNERDRLILKLAEEMGIDSYRGSCYEANKIVKKPCCIIGGRER